MLWSARESRHLLVLLGLCVVGLPLRGQEPPSALTIVATSLPPVPADAPDGQPLPINLPTALQLANARAVDIAAATERVRVAAALLQQARALWLPTVTVGGDYNRHDGRIQDVAGNVIDASRGSMMFGVGTGIGAASVLSVNDAIFAPLVARQTVRAREADLQAAANDTVVAVSDAYFTVQQARGELAGAAEATHRTEELVRRTRLLATDLVPQLETVRAEAELVRRQQAEQFARERWQVSSAELLRVLRLDPTAQVQPQEPPHLSVDLIDLARTVDDLVVLGLTNRPELASRQAQVQATLAALRQERLRPLVPSVLIRGWSTPVTGTLAAGVFGGGTNGSIGNTGLRGDIDLQLLWQFDNLGFGNRGRVRQREAENRAAAVELFRIQDRVAADVAQAYAQATTAARRVPLAEQGVRLSVESADKNLVALGQTKRAGELSQTLVRPQEAVAAVQALAQAFADYYGAVADYNRAQFRLYRALGQPAQCIIQVQELATLSPPALSATPTAAPATESVPAAATGASLLPVPR
jgi:outer membrane protein TolC